MNFSVEPLESRRLLSLVPPVLNSVPGAPVELYLDFVGSPAFTWNGTVAHGPGPTTAPIPAFQIDGNGSTFTSTELTAIEQIWSVVSEKFSPFNINVSTVDPGNRTHGVTDTAIIGGSSSDWYGSSAGGVSQVGSFTNAGLSNYVFAWTVGLPWGNPFLFSSPVFVGTAIAHEIGHSFGLQHQGDIDANDNVTQEYSDGNSLASPIMGNGGNDSASQPGLRGTWWNGPADSGSPPSLVYLGTQDDLPIITDATNGFGYRADLESVVTMIPNSQGDVSGSGIIIHNTDVDPFVFRATGTTASFTINNNPFGGMLAPEATLLTQDGALVAFSTDTNTSCTITAAGLQPGQDYYLDVVGQSGEDDIGQYFITGQLSPFTLYVDSAVTTGLDDGSSWANAFPTLQQALAVAQSLPTAVLGSQIDVAEGDGYNSTAVDGVNGTFQLVDNVAIYGGYAGAANPTAPRNPSVYPTLLTGYSGYQFGNFSSYHVVTGSGTNNSAVLEGFTIYAGDADGTGQNADGGGMIVIDGDPKINDCIFSNNTALDSGGAVYEDVSGPIFTNCVFTQNSVTATTESGYNGIGGAVFDAFFSSAVFVNCTFSGNTAAIGGGAMGNGADSDATLTNCILWNDPVSGGAQEIFNDGPNGGAVFVEYSDVEYGSSVYSGGHNIFTNPLFIVGTNLQLGPGSPAINTGLNSAIPGIETDLAGNPRIAPAGGAVDMGAYEFQGPFIIYVDQGAVLGADDGASWANAFVTLRQALAAATYNYTIEVAGGTYCPGFLITDNATFALESGVTIQGGYASGGSSSPQPSVNVTILDGYGYADHVVTGSGTNSSAVLDGFTIEDGDADGGGSNNNGGGLFDNDGSPTIMNCTFSGNSASDGGAIYDEDDSDPSFVDCTFTDNSATDEGGAMANESGSFPFAYNCEFLSNFATFDGGAIYNSAADVFLLNCTFTGNNVFALAAGGAGGAMANFNDSTPDLINCILYNDSAPSYAEIYNSGSTPSVTYSDVDGGYFGTGNINANPLFVSGTKLELQTGSLCINTGDDNPVLSVELQNRINTDLAGNPRIAFTTVDMGAYEYQGPTLLIYSQELPANVTSGITTSQVIVYQEQNGVPVSDGSTVTLSISGNPAGVTLQGNTAAVNSSGQAVFKNLVVTGAAGSYELEATDGADSPVISSSFNLTAQAGTTPGLAYLTPPPATVAADTVLPAVVVEVELNGSRDTSDNSSVSLAVGNVTIATAAAVQGEATFNGLEFTTPGNFLMVAYDGNYGLASAPITVSAPVVTTSLVFGPTPLPTSVQEGQAIAPSITVTEVPSSGSPNDNSSYVTLTLVSSPTGGTLGGTLVEKVANNVATFSNLTPSTPGTYEITATDGNDTSAEFSITALAPATSKLVFSTISNFQVGLDVPVPPFSVSVEESNGTVDQFDDSTITVIVLIPNDGAYDPRTATVQATQGVATFDDYFIGTGRTFTLQASDPADGLTGVSQPFTITPGPADYLYIPEGITAVAGTSTSIYVQGQDILRNVAIGDNSSLSLTLDNGPADGTLGGMLTTSFIAGIALFDNVLFDNAGVYDLTITDADDDISQAFEISVTANPVPAELAFVQQPGNTSTGFPIDPPVTVGVEDQFGNLITSDDSGEVTLSIASATGNATLGGVVTAAVQNGIATFNQVTLSAAGTYTLLASDGSDTDATSTSFMVAVPATIYVDQTATGGNTGQDWPGAFTNLQSALAVAVDGDTIDVAQGDYSPGGEATDTFQLIDGVNLQGGYQTGGLNGPNPAAYPTILDGMGNNYHVVMANGTDFSSALEGFTITNGNADGNGDSDSGYGGGLVADGGSPSIIDCIFTNNTAIDGGAAYFTNEGSTTATLVNCLFVANTASQSGGAIYDNDASPTVSNCTFTANSAVEYGGAFENDQTSNPVLTNCILWNDTAGYAFEEISNDYVLDNLGSSNPIVNNTDVDGGYSGTNNIDADPMFVNATSNNYQLQVTSPCINDGDNGAPGLAGIETDLAGNPRFFDNVVDMGAYEAQVVAIIWTGFGDGYNWGDPNNWSDQLVPTQNDAVSIPTNFAPQLASGSFSVHSLTIEGNSELDIGTGSLAIDYGVGDPTPLSSIRAELLSGYKSGAWNGEGIVSSFAATHSGYAVGYADGSTDSGTPAQPGQVLLKYALTGDANLDGTVNLTDLLALLNSYGESGKDWAAGDFNYDGTVNLTDLLALLNNYGETASTAALTNASTKRNTTGTTVTPEAITLHVASNPASPAVQAVGSSTLAANSLPAANPPIAATSATFAVASTLFSNVPITTNWDILGRREWENR